MLGAYDTRYHNANELNTLGVSFRTSPNVVLTVVRADANNYCVAATNSSGAKDGSGIGNAVGLKTAIHTRDRDKTTLVTSSDPGCLYSGPVSTSNGYYDSSGYHAGAVKF